MLTPFRNWYRRLTTLQQLMVVFVLNWCLWFCSMLIKDTWFLNEKHSLIYRIFDSVWMALVMTTFLNWDKTKALFHRKNISKLPTSNDV